MQVVAPPVPQGPRAYRTSIRRLGPLAALLLPAAVGGLALLLVRGSASSARGLPGFGLAVLAAPALLVFGVPMRGGTGTYVAAALTSAALWFVLGLVAARRATRQPAATWRDFWREYAWLAGGVWLGVVLAALAADLVLGRPFL
jgi:hypothetical protein